MNTAAKKLTQSNAILNFYKNLSPNMKLPAGVAIMNPVYRRRFLATDPNFYNKFYNDHHPRTYMLVSIPGAFGGGVGRYSVHRSHQG